MTRHWDPRHVMFLRSWLVNDIKDKGKDSELQALVTQMAVMRPTLKVC